MEVIPLLCKICPKQPRFSDVSHLLTHVASKGHLSHYRNAKIRSREDSDVRQQLDEFDEWYDRYGIERLESQRVVQKDARNRTARTRPSVDVVPSTSRKPRKPRSKSAVLPANVDEVGEESVIDPRLSGLQSLKEQSPATGKSPQHDSPPPFDLTSLHPVQATRTRPWISAVPRYTAPTVASDWNAGGVFIKSDTDAEVVDWVGTSSPLKLSYPDPSELERPYPFESAATPALTSKPLKKNTVNPDDFSEHSPQTSESGTACLIKLKGPQWPGMALFDSASPKAQRLRNQRKEHSILEQMEHNSMIVQPIERIYFPEGTLKKERPITGNVESSPLIEPTPKPKRRRQRSSRAALDNLSTNAPKTRIRKPTKRATPSKVTESIDIRDPFTQGPMGPAFAEYYTSKASRTLAERNDHDDSNEWTLNSGLPNFENQRPFSVFRDTNEEDHAKPSTIAEQQPATIDYPFLRLPDARSISHHTAELFAQSSMLGPRTAKCLMPALGKPSVNDSRSGTWDHSLRNAPSINANKENIEPLLDPDGHIDNEAQRAGNQRVTQRYFAVSGNDPPRFFDTMPSQMEFGGLADPRSMGPCMNPLNPQYMRPRPRYQMEAPFATSLSYLEDDESAYNITPKTE